MHSPGPFDPKDEFSSELVVLALAAEAAVVPTPPTAAVVVVTLLWWEEIKLLSATLDGAAADVDEVGVACGGKLLNVEVLPGRLEVELRTRGSVVLPRRRILDVLPYMSQKAQRGSEVSTCI